jgi:ABC-type Mn2+/Zn2+ transport system ATPase subunit
MQDKHFVEHRGKKYFLKRIDLKNHIALLGFCEQEIEPMFTAPVDVNDEQKLQAIALKWKEFVDRTIENADEALELLNMAYFEARDFYQDFSIAYLGLNPSSYKKLMSNLKDSGKTTE